MNILILNWRDVHHPKFGGAEIVTMEHAKGWVAAGHRVTWLTAGYSGAKKQSTVEGVQFVRRAGSFTVYLYASLYVLVNTRTFDVIVDEVHGFPFFSRLFTRKPVVIFIHEIAGEIWDYMFSFPKSAIGKLLERWYFQLYKHCLFWTDAPSTVNELVAQGIPRRQCVAIPCPIPPGYQQYTKINIRKEQRPTYLFVSRVVRMKGIEEVIKAFSFIAREQTGAVLWIVGGGELHYIQELTRMAEEYGVRNHVTFFGNLSEKEKYERMRRAHLLLHASVKEGWGLVVLEAAASGTPAVVYNVPGLRDVVQNDQTGVVIANNSPSDMAREAVKLQEDPIRYRELQKSAKQWAMSLHWSDVCKQSERVLKQAYENMG